MGYTTDAVGNITELNESADLTSSAQTIESDKLNRLKTIRAGGSLVEDYTYDRTGNRLSRQAGANPPEAYTYAASG